MSMNVVLSRVHPAFLDRYRENSSAGRGSEYLELVVVCDGLIDIEDPSSLRYETLRAADEARRQGKRPTRDRVLGVGWNPVLRATGDNSDAEEDPTRVRGIDLSGAFDIARAVFSPPYREAVRERFASERLNERFESDPAYWAVSGATTLGDEVDGPVRYSSPGQASASARALAKLDLQGIEEVLGTGGAVSARLYRSALAPGGSAGLGAGDYARLASYLGGFLAKASEQGLGILYHH